MWFEDCKEASLGEGKVGLEKAEGKAWWGYFHSGLRYLAPHAYPSPFFSPF